MAEYPDVDPLEQPLGGLPTIYVDGEPREAPGEQVTGAQILALVGKSPGGFELYARGHHGLRIAPEEAVPVQEGSQFETRPRR